MQASLEHVWAPRLANYDTTQAKHANGSYKIIALAACKTLASELPRTGLVHRNDYIRVLCAPENANAANAIAAALKDYNWRGRFLKDYT